MLVGTVCAALGTLKYVTVPADAAILNAICRPITDNQLRGVPIGASARSETVGLPQKSEYVLFIGRFLLVLKLWFLLVESKKHQRATSFHFRSDSKSMKGSRRRGGVEASKPAIGRSPAKHSKSIAWD
jgi:hypothetical protein